MAVIHLVIGTFGRELKNNGSAPKSYAAIYQQKLWFLSFFFFFSAVVDFFFI